MPPEWALRAPILAEQIEIVHRLWDRGEEEVSIEGAHYRLTACSALPAPLQQPRPPLIIGGAAGPRSARLAARWADEYNVVFVDPATARDRHRRISLACEAIGRDPGDVRFSMLTRVVIGASERDLEQRATALMERLDEHGDVRAFIDGMRPTLTVGTVGEVLDRLGSTWPPGFNVCTCSTSSTTIWTQWSLIGQEVIPEVAAR